jgi:DNA polymerase delta subunit 3
VRLASGRHHTYIHLRVKFDTALSVGHEVTEDYSSYESVDEEEEAPPAEKSAKGKGKKKITTAPIKVKDEEEAEEATAKEKEKAAKPLARTGSTLKRKPSKPSVQKGGIASYFNKK